MKTLSDLKFHPEPQQFIEKKVKSLRGVKNECHYWYPTLLKVHEKWCGVLQAANNCMKGCVNYFTGNGIKR